MLKRSLLALSTLLALTFFVTALSAGQPASVDLPEAEVATPDLTEMLDAQVDDGPLMSVDQQVPNPAAEPELLSAPSYYGICWTSCFPCTNDAQCPFGQRCRFGVYCP